MASLVPRLFGSSEFCDDFTDDLFDSLSSVTPVFESLAVSGGACFGTGSNSM